ncbi:MAG: inverse autotransporter beta domain-containing protein, partial [Proteobacteria bacterium]|nr:inverse autotransporter beta domain-containing protein [Pseudomonadota bacterium]
MSILSASSESPVSSHAKNSIDYQSWQQYHLDSPAVTSEQLQAVNVGSFVLNKPQSEIVLEDLQQHWGEILQDAVATDAFTDYARQGLKNKLIGAREYPDFQQWLTARRTGAVRQLLEGTATYLTDYALNRSEENIRRLEFVRSIDWDYRSRLGERKWQAGLSALGAVRETDDDALVWQLRGYAAEQGSIGANAGIIYRRAVQDDLLLGSNLFLDYEKHGSYDEDFFRRSLGFEARSSQLDLYINRYWAITPPAATDDGKYIYSKDGYDIELAIRPYEDINVSGGVTYYKWQGEFGDTDESGLLYNLRFQPFSSSFPSIELELEQSHSDDLDWGAKFNYRHKIGAPTSHGSTANNLTFDAREHFFDPIRREYSQRIAKSAAGLNAGGEVFITVLVGAATVYFDNELDAVTLIAGTAEGGQIFTAATITVNNYGIGSTVSMVVTGYYSVVGNERSSIILRDNSRVLEVLAGTVSLARAAGSNIPEAIESGGVIISMMGTEVQVGTPAVNHSVWAAVDSGMIFVKMTNANQFTVEIPSLGATVLLEEDYIGGLGAGNTITLGCGSARQRDFNRYYSSAFTLCVGDLLFDGFTAGDQISLNTSGTALTISINGSNRFTVSGESFLNDWERYPFSPVYNGMGTIKLLTGAGNLIYGTVIMTIAASTYMAIDSGDGKNLTIYVREGGISTNGKSVDCNGNLDRVVEENLVILAACGDSVAFNVSGSSFNINSRSGFTVTTTLEVNGGDGNYNFALNNIEGATGIISLLNDNGKVPTLVLYSADASTATYQLQATPATSEIAEFVEGNNININATIFSALEFVTPTTIPVFRSELDSGIHLITVNVGGVIGTLTYNLQVAHESGAATLTLLTVGNNPQTRQALVSLVSAGTLTVENAAFTLIATDSTNIPKLNST